MKRKQDRRFTARGGEPRRRRAAHARPVAALLALAIVVRPTPRATYKWVDEKGVVHYTDKIPPEAVNKGNVQLDKHGVPVKRTDPAPTPEQRKAKADEEARQQQIAKERELVDRRDRALLATYTMESEIELARKRALFTIEQQMQSSTAYSAQLNKRKAELEDERPRSGQAGAAGARARARQHQRRARQAGRPRDREAEGDHPRQRALRHRQEALARAARCNRGADERDGPR